MRLFDLVRLSGCPIFSYWIGLWESEADGVFFYSKCVYVLVMNLICMDPFYGMTVS